ncbi:hypothetical protein [Vibrio sp. R78045]|uniref:hypothetical protein n=1 Tax=Vibrio sp. R78045 TaxID=3093868 RepID=UPI0036F422D6
MNWMNLGYRYCLTSSGQPYKTEKTASRSAHASVGVICEYDDGYAVRIGTEMTEEEADYFIECYIPFKKQNQVYAEGVYEAHRKPWPIEQPDLCSKYSQARSVLKLNYWQMSYEQVKQHREFRTMTHKYWQNARIKHGLPIDTE